MQALSGSAAQSKGCETFLIRVPCAGVIWRGDSVIEGVPETLDMLRGMVRFPNPTQPVTFASLLTCGAAQEWISQAVKLGRIHHFFDMKWERVFLERQGSEARSGVGHSKGSGGVCASRGMVF
jgi:hypothetical protein